MTKLKPLNWNYALLTQNPFSITPPTRPEEAVWAGFDKLKAQLDNLFTRSFTTNTTQVVLNRGEYGSGKTHAATFYRKQDALPVSKRSVTHVKDSIVIYVKTPRQPELADEYFYQSVIEGLRFHRIRDKVKDMVTAHGEDKALQLLQDSTESEDLGKAIWLLGFEREQSGRLTLFDDNESEEWQRLLRSYFFSKATSGDLKKLGLSRSIRGTQDRFRMLAGIIQCLIGFNGTEDIRSHSRVILWIDELEDLIYYSTKYYRPFTQGLRELIDRLPHYFSMLMNFTLASPEALEDVETVLGRALLDRVTDEIYFREPTEGEAFDYVRDLLQHYRPEEFSKKGVLAIYPFEEKALSTLIADLPSRTPRDINQQCAYVIQQALQMGIISGVGRGTINIRFINELERNRVEADMQ
ncbi:MAG TPA: hypothetical protein VGW12_07670 [Pyrinomonadaceae bacterium]|nr:hypothetical protein [Pyrinomonadaceae bacterium]